MASYKYLTENDRVVSSTTLETAVSQATLATAWDTNIRPNGSTSPNELFYIFGPDANTESVGISYGTTTLAANTTFASSSYRAFNQFCHTLLGYKADGTLKSFTDVFGSDMTDDKYLFYTFPRATIKDKIMSGSVSVTVNTTVHTDKDPAFEVQTGEARLLKSSGNTVLGAVFYEAGIIVMKENVVTGISSAASMYSAATSSFANSGVGKVTAVAFNAATELNSTVYFCRAYNNEFNYSSNPTYLDDSMIIVKDGDPMEEPSAYITSVGLYDDNNQLLAVAKLSEPIKKTASTELIIRTRLDF